MTIEEAIQHAREVALSNAACGVAYRKGGQTLLADSCDACVTEHEQLAEWLTELKQRREAEIGEKPKSNGDRIRKMNDEELAHWLNDEASYTCNICTRQSVEGSCYGHKCEKFVLEWLKQEVSEDAGSKTD